MATEHHTTTRRAVIGAVLVAPALAIATPVAIAGLAAPDRSAWDRAFAAMLRAKAASEADATYDDQLGQAFCDAQSSLIQMPAPDRSALLWKLDVLFGEDAREPEGFGASWCGEWMDAVMADARRLLRDA